MIVMWTQGYIDTNVVGKQNELPYKNKLSKISFNFIIRTSLQNKT